MEFFHLLLAALAAISILACPSPSDYPNQTGVPDSGWMGFGWKLWEDALGPAGEASGHTIKFQEYDTGDNKDHRCYKDDLSWNDAIPADALQLSTHEIVFNQHARRTRHGPRARTPAQRLGRGRQRRNGLRKHPRLRKAKSDEEAKQGIIEKACTDYGFAEEIGFSTNQLMKMPTTIPTRNGPSYDHLSIMQYGSDAYARYYKQCSRDKDLTKCPLLGVHADGTKYYIEWNERPSSQDVARIKEL
ncbi:hypothetical protein BDV96DRAFT_671428 [Lophiotrema nucula]|uniref:Uncharacterized protein n=1 Tax=Lophiotrema nucula TaxID=690887 RepID=A0A6A5YN93_9PLEO|nr:hypothetical protein BDV96DRAFT_671428 [Lophiotrema nucula]